jgi:predicted kinase/catechol 2,3-dioxygenase-like lactoylglutathione lyase family enzyme
MCGLPFAGKSTLARALATRLGAVHLELDAINVERGLGRGGAPLSDADWAATYREGRRRLEDHLAAGHSVVYDAVSFRWAHREQLRRIARRHGAAATVVHVAPPVAEIGRRRRANRARPTRGDVRPKDFALVAQGFQPPRPEEATLVYDGIVLPDRWARDLAHAQGSGRRPGRGGRPGYPLCDTATGQPRKTPLPNVEFDHCVIHVSDWERSNAFYRDVLGAELVPRSGGWAYRFGATQLNLHGPGIAATPLAKVPVAPGGSDLCFAWPGPIEEAIAHLSRHRVPVELGPTARFGARGAGTSVYFRDPDGSLLEFIAYTGT